MGEIMKKILLWFGIVVSCLLWNQVTVQAGEINGNEASVLSAANGTFEYQGKTYVARQEYKDQLAAKMSADDVDLNAEQASEAIAEIYSNVATGVKEGYLQEVSSENPSSGKDNGLSTRNPEQEGDASVKESASPESSIVPAEDGSTEGTVGNKAKKKKPSKGKFPLNMKAALERVQVTEQSSAGDVKKAIMTQYFEPVFRFFPIAVILVTGILLVWIVWNKKGKWKKIWPVALSILLLNAGISMGAMAAITEYGFCSGKVLVNRVAAEGYYKKVYATFHENTAQTLKSAGFPENLLDDLFDERSLYLDGKLALEATFNSGRSKEFMDVQEQIKEKMIQYLVQENYSNVIEISDSVGNLAGIIQNSYTDSLKFTYAEQMKEEKEQGQALCNQCILLGIVLCVLGLALLILSQRYIHRIFRVVGRCFLAVAIATGTTAVWYLLTGQAKDLGLLQENYSRFFSRYMEWNIQLLIAVAGLEVLCFLVSLAATLSFKKIKKRNPFRKIKG